MWRVKPRTSYVEDSTPDVQYYPSPHPTSSPDQTHLRVTGPQRAGAVTSVGCVVYYGRRTVTGKTKDMLVSGLRNLEVLWSLYTSQRRSPLRGSRSRDGSQSIHHRPGPGLVCRGLRPDFTNGSSDQDVDDPGVTTPLP